ncbi:MAG: hypothetical protein ACT4OO_10470 [Nitrospiraceae bacterium]
MTASRELAVRKAIATISQADPILKLLEQVRLGRMRPTDAGLRVVTETWLSTYQSVIEKLPLLDRTSLCCLDPAPRLEVLIEAGVLAPHQPSVVALRAAFAQALDRT